MIQTSVKITGGTGALTGAGRQSLGGKGRFPLTFAQEQMRQIGQFGLDRVIARTKRGIGSDDSPFPALSQKKSAVYRDGKFVRQRVGYAEWKAKHGLQPIRDMVGTGKDGGHMLDNPSVRSVSETSVKIAFTSRKARDKALSNEKRTPFFSFSPSDERKIIVFARRLFGQMVEKASIFRRAA